MRIDEKRLNRQKQIVRKWAANSYKGIVKAVTGSGKTFIGILAINDVLTKRPNANIVVVVPTLYLKQQWENILNEFKLTVKVLVINTASKTRISCDLLIIDEIHTAGAEYWFNVFDVIEYKAILGLTATLERSDGRHNLILEKVPIVDEITLEEALREGYISDYKIYNLPVELTKGEQLDYRKTLNNYMYYERLLGGKFEAWNQANTRLQKSNKENYTTDEKREALMFLRYVNKRKSILHNAFNKVQVTRDILNLYPDRKSIIFCESIDFAEKIDDVLAKQSVIYHSRLTVKQKKEAIARFKDGRTSINVLTSVRALDAGVDISGVNLGICCAGTSKSLQSIQRLGRSIRVNENGTIAYYFNLYVKDTQEEKWLKSRCYNIPNIEWIDSLNNLIYGKTNN